MKNFKKQRLIGALFIIGGLLSHLKVLILVGVLVLVHDFLSYEDVLSK